MSEETPKGKDPQAPSEAYESQPSGPSRGEGDLLDDPSRRDFFKRVALGGGAALLAGGAT